MSSRQMRRLRKQQEELQNFHTLEEEEGSSDGEDTPAPPMPRANAFAGFAALADDGGDENEQENEDDEAVEDAEASPATSQPAAEEPTPAKKPKKSKKKKGKKGKKATTDTAPEAPENDVDEIDRAISELKLAQSQQAPQSANKWAIPDWPYNGEKLSGLLQINFQHLKAMNEMRKVFGREAIDAAIAEDTAQEAANLAERLRQQRVDLETYLRGNPNKPLSDVILKRNPFIDGKKSWPNDSTAGLTMKPVSSPDSLIMECTFAHDRGYDALEREFFMLVQTYDPMSIVHFLHRHPYHVSSLIQASKIAKQDQNSALAAELCERALFTFGRATLSSWRKKLEQGLARLDCARPENRQFYLAGYNYIKNLIRKGTYRTALEWTKLFIGLNADDPYGMINWLHVLAIRAHEAEWFVDLCGSELLDEGAGILTSMYIKQTLPLAKLQLNDRVGAKAALIEGMERLPWLFAALFSQLNLDIPKSIWGAQPRDEKEELYTKLYIHMAMDLWNNPQATDLLTEAAQAVQKVNIRSLPAAPPVTLSTARFVYLDDTPGMLGLLPRGMLDVSPNFDFDPLPPPEADNIFSSETQRLPWQDRPARNPQPGVHEVLELLERRVNARVGRDPGADGNDPEDVHGALRELPPDMRAGVDAMIDELVGQDGLAQEGPRDPGGLLEFIDTLRGLLRNAATTANANDFPDVNIDQMPGAWADDDDEEELPELVPSASNPHDGGGTSGHPGSNRHAHVEDADGSDSEDDSLLG
ncbi:hypothetical protein GQ53DRAFT_755382 [Thozetella sp. PMI_491]|nr:hypothetical protein GQ53DRAFT_755382 [Thozetella sp. PMI_491]